jgi:hypothetical protein
VGIFPRHRQVKCHDADCRTHFPAGAKPEQRSLAKELNDAHGLAAALLWATILGHLERIPDKVARLASDLIELSTRQNFAFWLPAGDILRGWARSASGSTAEGTAWIEDAIRDYQATGAMFSQRPFGRYMISLNSIRRLVIAAILVSSTIRAAEPQSLDRMLEPYLKEFGLPAIAAIGAFPALDQRQGRFAVEVEMSKVIFSVLGSQL